LLPCIVGDKLHGVVRVAGPDLAGLADLWLVTSKSMARYAHMVAFREFIVSLLEKHKNDLTPAWV
jgi:hypothetical protein